MKISIALAAYNGETFLSDQLDSFASQTRLPDELIITDDGSTDGTIPIIEAFATKAPFPVRLEINRKNLGFAQNFNHAISLCTGDLVFLSDQDDVWMDKKIEYMTSLAEKYPEKACLINNTWLCDGNLVSSNQTKLDRILSAGLEETDFVMGCCMALRKNFLRLALPVPESMPSHDNWIAGLADNMELTLRLQKPLQYYRLHGGNTSSFFINTVSKPNIILRSSKTLYRLIQRSSSHSGFRRELQLCKEMVCRLESSQSVCEDLVGKKRMDEILYIKQSYLQLLAERDRVISKKTIDRPRAVLELWRKGGYQSRLGALKDLFALQK